MACSENPTKPQKKPPGPTGGSVFSDLLQIPALAAWGYGEASGSQPSTFTDTLVCCGALGAVTVSTPSR